VTEIPEHLLRRSRERRQQLGLPTSGEEAPEGGAPSAAAEPTAGEPTVPATTEGAAPAITEPAAPPEPAAPEPPAMEPTYVHAARRRVKLPTWAMAVAGLLPIWGLLYIWSLTPNEEEVEGPLAVGAEVYGSCSSCHGSSGQGGIGYPFTNGEVLKTFPKLEDQVAFVYTGNAPFLGGSYGDPNREGGARVAGTRGNMPQWGEQAGGELSDTELIAVVCHERYTLSGGDQESEEFLNWCAPDAPNFVAVESGEQTLADFGINPQL
jgi:mono/diheme cytochrome c family protein